MWIEFISQVILKWLGTFRFRKIQGTTKPLRAPRQHLGSLKLVIILK
jgi:hypothetical protein